MGHTDNYFSLIYEDDPDSQFSMLYTPAKIKERPPHRSHNVCCCPNCGCNNRDASEDIIMSDPDTDTASTRSSDSDHDFPVEGDQGIEDMEGSFVLLAHSFHNNSRNHQHRSPMMEQYLAASQEIAWPLQDVTAREITQASPVSPDTTDSMMAESGGSDTMLSIRSLPRAPSPGGGYSEGIGAVFGEDAAATAPWVEMHCRNGQMERRSSGDISDG